MTRNDKQNRKTTRENRAPAYIAFHVSGNGEKGFWTRIGAAWHHEDGVGWGLDTDAATLLHTVPGLCAPTADEAEAICRAVRCPVLLVHGDDDRIVPYATGVELARWTGGDLVTVRGGGHAQPMREPVLTNRLIARPVFALARSWRRRTTPAIMKASWPLSASWVASATKVTRLRFSAGAMSSSGWPDR